MEYFLTEAGKALLPVIAMMESWGIANKDMIVNAEESLRQFSRADIKALPLQSEKCLINTATY